MFALRHTISALIVIAIAACGEVKETTTMKDGGGSGSGNVCTPNTTRCNSDKVERCSEAGTAWSVQETCTKGCNASSGACNGCSVAGANLCVGLDAHTCNSDMMGTTLAQACGAVGCDPATGSCKKCNPAANQCGTSEYCEAANCTTTGFCKPRPATSDQNMALVCGCDGVTYWNVTHARFLGAATGAVGMCMPAIAKSCNADSGAGCGTGEYCNTLWWRSGTGCSTATAGAASHSQCFNKPQNFSCPVAADNNGAQYCSGGCTNDCVGYSSRQWRGAEGCGA